MMNTYQFDNQSVYEHGISVYNHYKQIVSLLTGDINLDIPIPDHIIKHSNYILNNIYDDSIIEEYCIMHDLGKPYCQSIDNLGRKHFYNHSEVSYNIYNMISDNKIVAGLILHDMDIHIMRSSDFDRFKLLDKKQQLTHILVGLAELISNSKMFGGFDNTNFKIKYKNYCKFSKRILENLSNEA